jgi:DNA (cytosine-5)-methyltransferase 1
MFTLLAGTQHGIASTIIDPSRHRNSYEPNLTINESAGRCVANAAMIRRLTPLECARLMGLPDDWLDGIGLSDSAKYRLIGASVAVPVVEWIARRMFAVDSHCESAARRMAQDVLPLVVTTCD